MRLIVELSNVCHIYCRMMAIEVKRPLVIKEEILVLWWPLRGQSCKVVVSYIQFILPPFINLSLCCPHGHFHTLLQLVQRWHCNYWAIMTRTPALTVLCYKVISPCAVKQCSRLYINKWEWDKCVIINAR